MSENLFKYFGPEAIEKVFADPDHVTLKCSLPKDFNDPYELFLTVDLNQEADVMAFYAECIGDLPQLPTTCFSRSPLVVPMWAHYAKNSTGFAVEFDEEMLSNHFSESNFDNVDYRDTANEALTEMLYRASGIGKPRHVYLLQRWVIRAAYYTKTKCWDYEQERRMVTGKNEVRAVGDLLLLDVPKDCIKTIIIGPQAKAETVEKLKEKAKKLECDYFQLTIGKSSALPFLIDLDGKPHIFKDNQILPSVNHCNSCQEPIISLRKLCAWCQIDESHANLAAQRNPFRLYQSMGMLESYIEGMDNISRRHQGK